MAYLNWLPKCAIFRISGLGAWPLHVTTRVKRKWHWKKITSNNTLKVLFNSELNFKQLMQWIIKFRVLQRRWFDYQNRTTPVNDVPAHLKSFVCNDRLHFGQLFQLIERLSSGNSSPTVWFLALIWFVYSLITHCTLEIRFLKEIALDSASHGFFRNSGQHVCPTVTQQRSHQRFDGGK